MFIINITYTADLESVSQIMQEHIEFLSKYYDLKSFIMSGRKILHDGGIIIAKANNIDIPKLLDSLG